MKCQHLTGGSIIPAESQQHEVWEDLIGEEVGLNLDFPKLLCKPEAQESEKGTVGTLHLVSGLPPHIKRLDV